MPINTSYYNYNSYLFRNNPVSKTSTIFDFLSVGNKNNENNLFNAVAANTKKSPVSENVQNFLTNAKVGAFDLKSTLDKLLGNNKTGVSSFDVKKAESSNKDVLTIKSVDSKKATVPSSFSVEVSQIATAQKNIGSSLKSKDSALSTGFTAGAYSFKLEMEAKSYTINFNVSTADTNEQVQQKITDAINSKVPEIKSSVLYDSKEGTSAIILESKITGVEKDRDLQFIIGNLLGTGLDRVGLDNVSQLAQNAIYSVGGGVPSISKYNEVNLNGGVVAVLKSDGMSTVNIIKDRESAIADVREIARAHNKVLEATNQNRDDMRTNILRRQINDLARANKNELSRIGIEVAADGYLRINEPKLKEAAEKGDLERFFTQDRNKNYGYANRLSSIADKVDRNAAQYATLSTSSFVKNISNINDIYFNPLQINKMNRYSAYENTGLLFNLFL